MPSNALNVLEKFRMKIKITPVEFVVILQKKKKKQKINDVYKNKYVAVNVITSSPGCHIYNLRCIVLWSIYKN